MGKLLIHFTVGGFPVVRRTMITACDYSWGGGGDDDDDTGLYWNQSMNPLQYNQPAHRSTIVQFSNFDPSMAGFKIS